ncbi:DUF5082 domain-containing protein [Listeria booriae]|uniref:DUF5082 domain-containing protein n=1 Tax=Listeria booriae TaxID=1552123 RepID=A0A099W6D4_9LIST|nr:DUF5082 family protein [Listeria booriae]KGL40527.1 hypothetical protein EP57_08195 [Listeria booriae]MBC1905461.1 DUF5082 domain-containing protein [Listeria booriae]MBC1914008.1 DUF5082 domain-containing protein [Listeria booriae]MBC2242478.1 DUF5082 domain-containing protein [Listeria booriae]STY41944.1 Uncharacterised protein [Listeria booriae]
MASVDELKNEQRKNQVKMDQCLSDSASIDEKLERLEIAKKKVDEVLQSAKSLKDAVEKQNEEVATWKGTKFNTYRNMIENNFNPDYKTLCDRLDEYYDDICDKITQLENERSDQDGLFGWFKSRVNDIGNQIEKLVHS